jgi:hypothetical protein
MSNDTFELTTPLALVIFNRPQQTARVFARIRAARPRRLFVIADGPRADRPSEAERVAAARTITEAIDWPCEVTRIYADHNMGCRRRISSGFSAVFDAVETAITLEDDGIPEPSFFRFCQELLERYRDDERIMVISGANFQFGRRRTEDSYYFSRYNHSVAWASWRRAWQHYDDEMRLWPPVRAEGWLADILGDKATVRFWTRFFDSAYEQRVDSWAIRWTLACWLQNGLTILPNHNLISNIGFGASATHTTNYTPFAEMATRPMPFPLRHPRFLLRDTRADAFTQRTLFAPTLGWRVRNRIVAALRSRMA